MGLLVYDGVTLYKVTSHIKALSNRFVSSNHRILMTNLVFLSLNPFHFLAMSFIFFKEIFMSVRDICCSCLK